LYGTYLKNFEIIENLSNCLAFGHNLCIEYIEKQNKTNAITIQINFYRNL